MGDFADGYALRALMENESGGGDEPQNLKWEFPNDWAEIPEPDDYEIIFLVKIIDSFVDKPAVPIRIYTYTGIIEPNTKIYHIDWGDGIITNADLYTNPYYVHYYKKAGYYIVKITALDETELPDDKYGVLQTVDNTGYTYDWVYATGEDYPEKEGIYPNDKYTHTTFTNTALGRFVFAAKIGNNMTFTGRIMDNDRNALYNCKYIKFCKDSAWNRTSGNRGTDAQGFSLDSSCNLCKIVNESEKDLSEELVNGFRFNNLYNLYDYDFLKKCKKLSSHLSSIGSNVVKRIDLDSCDDTELMININTAVGSGVSLEILNAPNVVTLRDLFSQTSYKTISGNSWVIPSSLREIHMPNCIKLPQNACNALPNLRILEVAEGCDLNGNTFPNCPFLEIKYASAN